MAVLPMPGHRSAWCHDVSCCVMIAPIDDLDRLMVVMHAAFDPALGEVWSRRQVEDALILGNSHYALLAPHGAAPASGEPAVGFSLSRFGVEEEELLLLAVMPQWRRRGLGSKLLQNLIVAALNRGAARLLLEMRRGNPAEALYRAHGFIPIGKRLKYYKTPSGERLDAITFAYERH